ncbi:MAG: ATP-binding cassette domain-containing protein [Clostridia bacterium]|nr:ATP-binding cassette domain-containing protein [Clostridia bacterium]
MAENEKKVLLSIKDLEVKFHVRSRILTAIRGISLDIYENESIAIVGESGSGKSVFTKTFAGMLDSNGFISAGSIIFNDDELADTQVAKKSYAIREINFIEKKLNKYSKVENGSDIYKRMEALKNEKLAKSTMSAEMKEEYDTKLGDLEYKRTDLFNLKQTFDPRRERDKIKETSAQIAEYDKKIAALKAEIESIKADHKKAVDSDAQYIASYNSAMSDLKREYSIAITKDVPDDKPKRNNILAKEIYLSIGRYNLTKRLLLVMKLLKVFKGAMKEGVDIDKEETRNELFDRVAFRVKYLREDDEKLYGWAVLNLAKINYSKDWSQIRGAKIATVFQDPMTSLNPILTIGKQITSIILKHQDCSEIEARERALILMKKVGIPNPEKRFDDYPFQYSGGMRQRIVIAIALSCQPKILICDEPTTALDVTIQAQILKLIKDLQKEFNYTIVFITHDLGVVANVADRVAVLYAGQLIELGNVEEIYYDPRHPYTWALLSSLPQLAQKNTKLYSITGTPPSLYNKIVGDPFAPRNPYCLKIDTLKEPPMFRVTDTHYAKTWLLDPRAPATEKPDTIKDTYGKLVKAFNVQGG